MEGLQPAALELDEATRDLIAGGFGGMAGVLVGQPLDTVRIRQQQPAGPRPPSAAGIFRATVAGEGTRSLFRGMAYPLASASIQNAVVFHAFGVASRHLGDSSLTTTERVFWAGCFAGAVQTAVVTPVDLLKIRLQLQRALPGAPGYVGPLRLLRRVLAAEGLPGLYRGALVTAVRDVPSHGVYFVAYQLCREALSPGGGSAAAMWAAGGVAGAVSWLSVYPIDVVKSRVQAAGAPGGRPYAGWLDCVVRSYQAEGVAVFFRGLGTTLGRAFLVNGAIFAVFETVHSRLS